MIFRSLLKGARLDVISSGSAAGTSAVNMTSLDMTGYESVCCVALLGTLTATQVTYLKAQGSNDNSTWVDLGSTKAGPAADADSNKLLVLDLYRPGYRYVRFVLVRGTANAVLTSALGLRYVAQREPVAIDAAQVSASVALPYAAAGTP